MAFSTLVVAITLTMLYTSASSAATDSFSVDLIHRDSIDSPLYDPSMSFAQRMGHTLQRSFINEKRLVSNIHKSTYQVDTIPDHGEFLMNISIGNPSHKVLAIADTGSDLTWIPCKPCPKCYKNDAPLFDPKRSSTYKPIACNSKLCKSIVNFGTRCTTKKNCGFFESYGDGSISEGTVSTETIMLGDRVLPDTVFGCSSVHNVSFRTRRGGVVGLGGGLFSLVTQLPLSVPMKFSYCLIPYPRTNGDSNKSSKMIFGHYDFGPNAVTIPLVLKNPNTFYHVTLEGISVGDKRLNYDLSSTKPLSKGNMIVDSGTTLTMLPPKLYKDFETAVRDAINVRTVEDPQKVLNLCYRSDKVTKVPKVTMHFEGADYELSRDNVFVTVSENIMCFPFTSRKDISILGNIAQINHLIGYDLENYKLSVKSTDCEKL